jgi:hypothetical protein
VILRIVETRIRQTCFDLDITKEKSSKILIRFFGINEDFLEIRNDLFGIDILGF